MDHGHLPSQAQHLQAQEPAESHRWGSEREPGSEGGVRMGARTMTQGLGFAHPDWHPGGFVLSERCVLQTRSRKSGL